MGSRTLQFVVSETEPTERALLDFIAMSRKGRASIALRQLSHIGLRHVAGMTREELAAAFPTFDYERAQRILRDIPPIRSRPTAPSNQRGSSSPPSPPTGRPIFGNPDAE